MHRSIISSNEVAINTRTVVAPSKARQQQSSGLRAEPRTKADMFLVRPEGRLPAGDVAIPASAVVGNISTFVRDADTTNSCVKTDGSDPTLSVSFTDGASRKWCARSTRSGASRTKWPARRRTRARPPPSTRGAQLIGTRCAQPSRWTAGSSIPDDGPWRRPGRSRPRGRDRRNGERRHPGIYRRLGRRSRRPGGWPLGDYIVTIFGPDSDSHTPRDRHRPRPRVRLQRLQPPIDPTSDPDAGQVRRARSRSSGGYAIRPEPSSATSGSSPAIRIASSLPSGSRLDAIETPRRARRSPLRHHVQPVRLQLADTSPGRQLRLLGPLHRRLYLRRVLRARRWRRDMRTRLRASQRSPASRPRRSPFRPSVRRRRGSARASRARTSSSRSLAYTSATGRRARAATVQPR